MTNNDDDEGILNPIVEELPMDEESDKRIFDEPSKKPDMEELSSVKPAPRPDDSKDDNKAPETKPIDEKAVPKDLSVSADIKEPQKLVAGVIYDDDDNEEDGREKRCRNNGQRRRIIFQRYRRGEQVQRD